MEYQALSESAQMKANAKKRSIYKIGRAHV